ncbi:S1/P1 Nuclease [Ekhidna lutea]|uniref:S1/P1 Nuclease n=1 Tax=Ekhidna lutea TaxID=447679 RepID=A0A239EPE1_EKHLU|nr:S1/P1 nuclease [Ekhidna lutea]SNS46536.1 S1/P1 Nuclease [Ekhidna lutea]
MKRFVLPLITLLIVSQSFAWGPTGHRIVGLIAERHLTNKARKNIEKALGFETLAEVSYYMDFIKSDDKYDYMYDWHFATIPTGKTYEEAGTPEEGDVIVALQRLISELETKEFTDGDEAFALKCLVHLIGDIHQPLHVGNGEDRGANDVKLDFFWKSSNLHRVWDSQMIEEQKFSYTEYAEWIDHPTAKQLEDWSSLNVLDWAYESVKYREQCYNTVPEDKKLSYDYVYENLDLLNQRLLQAGIRLANVLNEIYG